MRVLFMGRLRDLAGGEECRLAAPLDWPGLLAGLPEALKLEAHSDRVRVACDGRLLADKTALRAESGDEVALLPPVSGG